MSARSDVHLHATIHLVHGDMVVEGVLHHSAAKNSFEILLPPSGYFDIEDELRLPLTPWMLERLELLPDGSIRLEY